MGLSVQTRVPSKMTVNILGGQYNYSYTSGDYTTEYSRLIVLPKEAMNIEFVVSVLAADENGVVFVKNTKVVTKTDEVVFSVG
jgi:hypothetical protein